MTDTQAKVMHSRIWDLLFDYADIREELEDALSSIMTLYEELESAIEDIGSDLEDIENHLSATGKTLRRYRGPEPARVLPWQDTESEEKEALPWN